MHEESSLPPLVKQHHTRQPLFRLVLLVMPCLASEDATVRMSNATCLFICDGERRNKTYSGVLKASIVILKSISLYDGTSPEKKRTVQPLGVLAATICDT